jgi:ubiquinone/menaquinone biosynthesis C-methylase UbiE
MKFFRKDGKRAIEAITEAQKIAWAPMVFQSAKALRDLKILTLVEENGDNGISLEDISEQLSIPLYGARVLLEAGLGIGLVYQNEQDKYILTKTAHFLLHDEMTKVNMDFVHDVCYLGMYNLKESILNGKPEGLKVFGEWDTVYEGLSQLPKDIQKSWFGFDHFYSDICFPLLMPHIFKRNPKMIFDVGGNTGKFSMQCARYNPDIKITIVDLPGQIAMANKNIIENNFEDRVFFHPLNLLDSKSPFPKNAADIVWMSQFLDCFSEEEIISILSRAKEALTEDGALYILEAYWDRQKFESAAFSLQQTSLYFTAIANGNSQMYHSKNMIQCVHAAGLYVEEDIDNIGISHTLFICKKKS